MCYMQYIITCLLSCSIVVTEVQYNIINKYCNILLLLIELLTLHLASNHAGGSETLILWPNCKCIYILVKHSSYNITFAWTNNEIVIQGR